MKRIAIYGKGGIGKSTTASNVAAALAKNGLTVMQIGCDPKADSTRTLTGGKPVTSVLDAIRQNGMDIDLESIVTKGSFGVLCVEAEGPTPGVGCAGRGIITAFETLERLDAFGIYKPDVVIYDVLGDVVCGGFAMPIRDGYARDVFIVTSGEKMSMYAAGNIALAVENFRARGYARCAGLILNRRDVENELETVEKFADSIESSVIGVIPRDGLVQEAENRGLTVVEAFPESEMAEAYAALASKMMELSREAEDD